MPWGNSPFRGHYLSGRNAIRVGSGVLLLVSVGLFVNAAAGADIDTGDTTTITVVSEQRGPLQVYDQKGGLVYKYEQYERYWDIDPSPVGERTLLYTATAGASNDACTADTCQANVVGRLNLTTGEHHKLFERITSNRGSNEWHDVDRVNETHIVVADIKHDRVFIANTATDEITWQWNASDHYSEDQGRGPTDWTHLNDVEVLDDGRIMASIRNMDEVVFIRPGNGVMDDWTLGDEGNHDILHGQHNADYIPPERGGPAVIVADSHNNRIVEYQRVNGTWQQSWEWTDVQTQWTRDGDRLPNGHTLVTDTNGGWILEVDRNGTIVWAVGATKAYEAERLGTGDESASGESMLKLRAPDMWNKTSGTRTDGTLSMDPVINESQFAELQAGGGQTTEPQVSSFSLAAWQMFKDTTPPYLVNSVLFFLAPWIDPVHVLPLLLASVALVLWTGCELYWRVDPSPTAVVSIISSRSP